MSVYSYLKRSCQAIEQCFLHHWSFVSDSFRALVGFVDLATNCKFHVMMKTRILYKFNLNDIIAEQHRGILFYSGSVYVMDL